MGLLKLSDVNYCIAKELNIYGRWNRLLRENLRKDYPLKDDYSELYDLDTDLRVEKKEFK